MTDGTETSKAIPTVPRIRSERRSDGVFSLPVSSVVEFLAKFPRIYTRILEITASPGCSGVSDTMTSTSTCPIYNDCKSYYVFHVKDCPTDITTPEQVEASISQNITAYLILIPFPDMYEIYGVCTLSMYRGKGYMKKILTYITKNARVPIWLGVDLQNPDFLNVASLYIKASFGHVKRESKTFHGKCIPFQFVSLVFYPGIFYSNGVKEMYIDKVKKIKRKFDEANKVRTIPLYIDKSLFEIREKLIDNTPSETAGYLVPFKTIKMENQDTHEHVLFQQLVCPESRIIEGDTMVVVVDKHNLISFHTHPSVCYQKENCSLGWPSGVDVVHTIDFFPFNLKHYVWTVEGLYSMQLTTGCQKFLLEHSCDELLIQAICYLILWGFQAILSLRESTYIETSLARPELQRSISETTKYDMEYEDWKQRQIQPETEEAKRLLKNKFISETNSVSMADLKSKKAYFDKFEIQTFLPRLQKIPNFSIPKILEAISLVSKVSENFPIFNFGFYSWENIEKNNGILDSLSLCAGLQGPELENNLGETVSLPATVFNKKSYGFPVHMEE